MLGDDWLFPGGCRQRVDHVLELRTAAGFRRSEAQSGAIVRDAVICTRLPLDGESPVFAFARGVSAGCRALW